MAPCFSWMPSFKKFHIVVGGELNPNPPAGGYYPTFKSNKKALTSVKASKTV